jgi:hypothetical protein
LEAKEARVPGAEEALGAFHDRRAAEKEHELSLVRAAYGEPEPQVGTAVDDGVVIDVPLAHVDVATKVITGTSVLAGACPLCGLEMVLRYVGGRVQGVCPVCKAAKYAPQKVSRLRTRAREIIGDRRIVRVQRLLGPAVRWNLTALGRIYRTDKAGAHSYTPIYQKHFQHLRHRSITLLEIGIGGNESPTLGGASLRMWRDFFPRGQIHGVDVTEKLINEPRIHVHCGDQSDRSFLLDLGRQHGPFDIIIDDGSHINDHIRTTFEVLFVDHLKSGGTYVIEDMATAYAPEYGGGDPGYPETSVELVKDLVDDVNRNYWKGRLARPVFALHVSEQLALIEKAR